MEKSITKSVTTTSDFSSVWNPGPSNLYSFDNSLILRNIFLLLLCNFPVCLGGRELKDILVIDLADVSCQKHTQCQIWKAHHVTNA